jgi:heme-degrading monooxygenase HmoA
MIARIWKGAVRKQDGDAYARYMQETGVAGYAKSPGNNGVWMLRRDVDDRTEFVMFTLWTRWRPSRLSRATTTRRRSSTLRRRRCRRSRSRTTAVWPASNAGPVQGTPAAAVGTRRPEGVHQPGQLHRRG